MRGAEALAVLFLLAFGCSHSTPTAPYPDPLTPSERSKLIQARLTGTVAYLYTDDAVVWWVWRTEGYEFGQQSEGRLVVWEKGT